MDRPVTERLVRYIRLRRRRRARGGCLRCGAPPRGLCPACGAPTCSSCSVVSIETGTALELCRSCSGGPSPSGRLGFGPRPRELLRSGARLLSAGIGAALALAAARGGGRGAARVLLALLDPGVLLALGPLALVLGALDRFGRKALARALRR